MSVSMLIEDDVCPGCGERIESSTLTNSWIDSSGRISPLVHIRGGFLHLHGVSISTYDALTIRGSLRRWTGHARLRVRWHLRRLRP